jgi:hypothetical protein
VIDATVVSRVIWAHGEALCPSAASRSTLATSKVARAGHPAAERCQKLAAPSIRTVAVQPSVTRNDLVIRSAGTICVASPPPNDDDSLVKIALAQRVGEHDLRLPRAEVELATYSTSAFSPSAERTNRAVRW